MDIAINQIITGFTDAVREILSEGKGLHKIEGLLLGEAKACAANLVQTYIEHIDAEIFKDKLGRKKAGLVVERRGDERQIRTAFGELTYKRTYYKKASGGYEYPADTAFGVALYERVSAGVGSELVAAARQMSYGKAAGYVTGNAVSRQTVMSRIRQSEALTQDGNSLRRVPELHVDADEAHVTLCGGRNTEVPLVSVYEGIEKRGKRGACKNIFHISEYGRSPDALWEQALTEIERRYGLTGTKIYLHGDGAPWIQRGLEWLPDAVFVLDKYHKNKAILTMTAGFAEKKDRSLYGRELREALGNEDLRYFRDLTDSICGQTPERKKTIFESAGYLRRFADGISICNRDPGANRGGCTEPHVSHVLASRLSTRPMAWSAATLRKLAPILAAEEFTVRKEKPACLPPPLRKTAAKAAKNFRRDTAGLGLPLPEAIGTLPVLGRVSDTQRAVKEWL